MIGTSSHMGMGVDDEAMSRPRNGSSSGSMCILSMTIISSFAKGGNASWSRG